MPSETSDLKEMNLPWHAMAVSCCILVGQSFWKARQRWHITLSSVHQNPPKSWCKCLPCPSMSFPWDAWLFQSEQWQFSFTLFQYISIHNQPALGIFVPTNLRNSGGVSHLCVCVCVCVCSKLMYIRYQHAWPIQPHTITHTSLTNSSQLKFLLWIAGTEAIGARIRTLATSGLLLDRGSRTVMHLHPSSNIIERLISARKR